MIKIYEVVVKDLSVLIDSDRGYYHHFNIGDILQFKIKLRDDFKKEDKEYPILILNLGEHELYNPSIIINWSKSNWKKIDIYEAVSKVLIVDITTKMNREFKLKKLGI